MMNTVLLAHCLGHELLTFGVALVCGAACIWVLGLLRAAWRRHGETVRDTAPERERNDQ